MLSFDSQTFTWLGRRLNSYAKGGTTTNYTYNSDGVRTKKVSGSTATDYCLNGAQILAEKRGGTLINYFYTSDGTRVGFKTGGKVYYYVYNLQGDVTHIVDESKNIVATYRYDPFGKISNLSSLTSIGKLNPFRYRGYYYDTESNLYYLNSRYYNPEIGRFINADAILGANKDLISYNMFTYCGNNPLNRADPTGHAFMLITAAIGAVAGAVTGGIISAKKGKSVWAGIGIGAVAGALIGTGAGMAAGAALAGSITATTGAVMAGGSALVSTVATGGLGAGATYIANNLSQAVNNTAPAVQAGASKMQQVAAKGRAGEVASGLVKNTKRIHSLTGTASYRIPDGLSDTILSEVKNYSGTLSYTNQLKDFVLYSQSNGLEMHLYTNAHLTGPLQHAVDIGLIQVFPLK